MLTEAGAKHVSVGMFDFLDLEGSDRQPQMSLLEDVKQAKLPSVDIVIANPPYVRTQVLGAKKAQQIAKRFGLSGRIDLYHAFTIAVANSLKPGGVLGLLTSNRFLTIKSGIALRQLLRSQFDLLAVFDLGDTKLFETAAVLPVIVIARKRNGSPPLSHCKFTRIYQHRVDDDASPKQLLNGILDAMSDDGESGLVESEAGRFLIERGELACFGPDDVWTLSTSENNSWLATIRQHTVHTFDELAFVRVGVKTTADEVFINDWNSFSPNDRPENALLKPLFTHHNADRWLPLATSKSRKILYPHETKDGRQQASDLSKYPQAAAYLNSHKERLSSRQYVLDAGREWYEIWVPQQPADWPKPKIVYPDISEFPRFFIDTTGMIVNGDCYWITLRPQVNEDWLYLILAVANSTLITRFYDTVFHNKLYAGRRRFMTQYVKQFPLPSLTIPESKDAISLVKKIISAQKVTRQTDEKLDSLVWNAFGLK